MKYFELAKKAQANYKYPIILAKVGSQIHELADKVVNENENVEFLTTENKIGMRVYQRSLVFLFLKAVNAFAPYARVNVRFPLGDAVYIKCDNLDIQKSLYAIDDMMRSMAKRDIVIKKEIVSLDDAMQYFAEQGMTEKEELFSFRRVSSIKLYDMDGFKNYFYGDLVYSTGVLTKFKLVPFKNGVLLCYPNTSNPDVVADVLAPFFCTILIPSQLLQDTEPENNNLGGSHDRSC